MIEFYKDFRDIEYNEFEDWDYFENNKQDCMYYLDGECVLSGCKCDFWVCGLPEIEEDLA